jgi:patatin-like phospholipase/acyl hydrolase
MTHFVFVFNGGGIVCLSGHVLTDFSQRLSQTGFKQSDHGSAFDLLVGTSTGGIVACALAAGIQLEKVLELYQTYGKDIFHDSDFVPFLCR